MARTDRALPATATRDIVVMGASAGGVEALKRLVSGLPADFTAALFVVLHLPRSGISEDALWSAIRAIEEKLDLVQRVIRRADADAQPRVVQRLTRQAASLERQAAALRYLLRPRSAPHAVCARPPFVMIPR